MNTRLLFSRSYKELPMFTVKRMRLKNQFTLIRIKQNVYTTQMRTIWMTAARFQTKPETEPIINIFDRKAKLLQRERAALSDDVEYHSYLKQEIGYRLADRIFDIKRKFHRILNFGCDRGYVSKHIVSDSVDELVLCDNSDILMAEAICDDREVKTKKVVCDEENLLSVFEPESFDMVISNLTLHWVNELPKCFSQVMQILKSDGVFLGSVFGGDTLYELRSSLQLAESERKGGISPHISPFTRPRDIGGLLSQAGFVMQTVDTDEEILRYPTMFNLLEELKGMGENNAAWSRCLHLPRDTLLAASVIYEQLYGNASQKEREKSKSTEETKDEVAKFEGVTATFEIIFFIGWKPDKSQPQPLPRGSAQISLKDIFRDVAVKHGTEKELDGKK